MNYPTSAQYHKYNEGYGTDPLGNKPARMPIPTLATPPPYQMPVPSLPSHETTSSYAQQHYPGQSFGLTSSNESSHGYYPPARSACPPPFHAPAMTPSTPYAQNSNSPPTGHESYTSSHVVRPRGSDWDGTTHDLPSVRHDYPPGFAPPVGDDEVTRAKCCIIC